MVKRKYKILWIYNIILGTIGDDNEVVNSGKAILVIKNILIPEKMIPPILETSINKSELYFSVKIFEKEMK